MQLYLKENDLLWQPARYHYAIEQMLLTLFPSEKPEYPTAYPATWDKCENAAFFTLSSGKKWVTVSVFLVRDGRYARGQRRFLKEELSQGEKHVYHVLQRNLKLAFYRAGVALLGQTPPWGALTGVRPVKLPTRALGQGATPVQAQRALQREYDVSPVRARLATECALVSLQTQAQCKHSQVSLYIGIPFCPTRCSYCSFVSADVRGSLKLISPYLQALLQEIDATADALAQAGLSIYTLYVGGGTPTTFSADELDTLLTHCKAALPLGQCVEYTLEAGRPDTISLDKLLVLKRHGIQRISINPQTLEDAVLDAIGRKHRAKDIEAAMTLAREVGFSCINMDLIAGLPMDSYDGFCRSLRGVIALEPENITVHTLAIKKGAFLTQNVQSLPAGEETLRMLNTSLQLLSAGGYAPYYLYRQKYMSGSLENVGWAKKNTHSIYNVVMMEELQSVVCVGGGGVTKLVSPQGDEIVRLANPKYPHDYLAMHEKVLAQKAAIPAFYQKHQFASSISKE